MTETTAKKKLLERPMFASMVVPVAVILVAALIVFGLMRMLSSERSHRDLIGELQSKTFGNRWVAAYELSKLLATKKIPEEEVSWVIQNLANVYDSTPDARTKNFIILALGTFQSKEILPTVEKGILDTDSQVQFNSLVVLGNMPMGLNFPWEKIIPLVDSSDPGVQQASILTLSHHRVYAAQEKIKNQIANPDLTVRYAAATGLLDFQSLESTDILKEILFSLAPSKELGKGFNEAQVESLKLNVINAIGRNKITPLASILEKTAKEEKNIKISTKAKEALNLLKE